ncbi:Hypothetical protein SMAX5B_006929 [Scophthalmus maximus]|uniref:RELT-like protein 2 n=1 Tax=Scophthalmus maximus TaxID=52904 RepID=A0A2U9C7N0_SCOMX|nr:Hypothetical protein SMAX5B_006929 [Scophthalmus maximus]
MEGHPTSRSTAGEDRDVFVPQEDLTNTMTELEASGVGEHTPPYMIFLVVFLFFITGLLGFLVCHLLKKKGYRCRTGDIDDAEEEEEKVGGNADDEDEENQDTVEQILKCIIENEANMEAFNEMLGNHNICVRHDPRFDLKRAADKAELPDSNNGLENRRSSLLAGDQLDQSQDSEEQKEGVYNLRSMFKDVRPLSERTNGVVPNVGKRRKSVTIFGLRRGSDPVGIKGVEWAGREAGGVKSASQKPPVVLEELVQGETGQPESQRGKTGPMLSQEKDDMMEMEDIRDCKVQEAKRVEKMAHSQLKQD